MGGPRTRCLISSPTASRELTDFSAIITNPPGGEGNRTAVKFLKRGLERAAKAEATLALLLPADFDSGVTRRPFFVDRLSATIVLTDRIVWFDRHDGEKEAPKENHRWFIWRPDQNRRPAVHLYDGSPQ